MAAQIVALVVATSIGITGVRILNVIERHADDVGGLKTVYGASKKLALGLSGAHHDQYPIRQANQNVAIRDGNDRRTVQYDELEVLPQARKGFPGMGRGKQANRVDRL